MSPFLLQELERLCDTKKQLYFSFFKKSWGALYFLKKETGPGKKRAWGGKNIRGRNMHISPPVLFFL
jgi:hypothetical protein